MSELTHLLHKVQAGDVGARETLFAAAYSDLEQLARARLRDGGRSTLLDTRSLVHDSYLRYLKGAELRAEDRRAFFAYASQVLRSVVVNYARERSAQKRGSGWRPLTLSTRVAEQTTPTSKTSPRWSRGKGPSSKPMTFTLRAASHSAEAQADTKLGPIPRTS